MNPKYVWLQVVLGDFWERVVKAVTLHRLGITALDIQAGQVTPMSLELLLPLPRVATESALRT